MSERLLNKQLKNICFSGGARGSDQQFGICAEEADHTVVHFSFKGHSEKINPYQILVLEDSELFSPIPLSWIDAADKVLKRGFSNRTDYVKKLLLRNAFQIIWSNRVYAIGSIDFDKKTVNGGTGWAVEMSKKKETCKTWFFDQPRKQWFHWDVAANDWIDGYIPPKPEGKYTGIGTRKLTKEGKQAIINLYQT